MLGRLKVKRSLPLLSQAVYDPDPSVRAFAAGALGEFGATILVGGNIRDLTRTMTTTIALKTSQGDLSLALVLGAVLIGISISISAMVFAFAGQARTSGGDEV